MGNENQSNQGSGSAEGGGEQQENQQALDPAALQARIKELEASVQQRDAFLKQVNDTLAAAGGQEPQERQEQRQEGTDDEAYLDPAVQKLVDKRIKELEASVQQRVGGVADRLDQANFLQQAQELGLTKEEFEKVEGVYRAWVKKGVNFAGKPPSRTDALLFVQGQQRISETRAQRMKRFEDDEARRVQNEDATLEGGGVRRRSADLPDPTKLSREDRLEKYHPAVLDKEGF